MPRQRTWSDEELVDAVKSSLSLRQVIERLGLIPAGGNYATIHAEIAKASLDVNHFIGHAWNRGRKFGKRPRIALDAILVRGSTYQSFKLKRRLFAAQLKPQHCEECGWCKRSPEGYLPLELDHINGDRTDNRLENLRILCPNCHSLKPTHRARKLKGKARVVKG